MKGQKEEEWALKVTGGRTRGRSSNRRGHGRGRKSFNKDHTECYKCDKKKHYQYECSSTNSNANYVEFDDEEVMLLMAQPISKENPEKQVWFINSGYSNHICGCKDWFYDLDESFSTIVKLRKSSRIFVVGKGNNKHEIEGKVQFISNVYYILDLKNHLLSV